MGKPRRSFTPKFKVEAVKLVTEQGRSFAQAAANLGIADNLLRKWKQNLDAQGGLAFPGKGNLPALEEELRCLRAENKRLQRERDILSTSKCFTTVCGVIRPWATGPRSSMNKPRIP